MAKAQSKGKKLQKELFIQSENLSASMSAQEIEEAYAFCEPYKQFLTRCKTEREAVAYVIDTFVQEGFAPYDAKASYKPGDRFYVNNRGKAIILATMGKRPVSEGVRIVAAHIDSPRIDLKPRPLYEDSELAFFKTHYYGGIKKYQWAAIPLALHGVVTKKDGEVVTVTIGEQDDEPVFCVTDLLPHLAQEQMKRSLAEGIKGEELNVLVGSTQYDDEEVSERAKLYVMQLLHDKYGVTERDLLSAELTMVPAFSARDLGLDRSMIGSYGHDDRVCAYTALEAIRAVKDPEYTSLVVLADKEETGSEGNTGLDSQYLEQVLEALADSAGVPVRDVMQNSKCLSADVNVAFDPTFGDTADKRNIAFMNHGVVVTKYTGSRGKSGTSDASAEFTRFVCDLLDRYKVPWQTGELGRVDLGGGGTVAKHVAYLNIDVIDIGVPVLSMHAPFEVAAKLDIYTTYKAFEAFLR